MSSFKYLGITVASGGHSDPLLRATIARVTHEFDKAVSRGVFPGGLAIRSRVVAWNAWVRPYYERVLPFLTLEDVAVLAKVYERALQEAFAPDAPHLCVFAALGIPPLEELHARTVLRLFASLDTCPQDHLTKQVHDRMCVAPPGGEVAGIYVAVVHWLHRLHLVDVAWPHIPARTAAGQPFASPSHARRAFVKMVRAALCRYVPRHARLRAALLEPASSLGAYAHLAGQELHRRTADRPERWVEVVTGAMASQRLLERRAQGSKDIATHCRRGPGGQGGSPYGARWCPRCVEGIVGDAQHWLLFCPATETARAEARREVESFFETHPVQVRGVRVRWADFAPAQQEALLLGSGLPVGVHPAGRARGLRGQWFQQWMQVADGWTRALALARSRPG